MVDGRRVDGPAMVRQLVDAGKARRGKLVAALDEDEARRLCADWPAWVRTGQSPPDGGESGAWRVWVMMAGRGFGKTLAGAEWILQCARDHPGAAIALVAATAAEARALMVEGRSGVIAAARPDERREMRWEPSRGRLVFASGAEARLFSGAHPEGLRGPEHHFAWADELAKWRRGKDSWDNLMLGLRLGEAPRALATTTPRGGGVLRAVLDGPGTVRTGGATRDNPHLAPGFVAALEREHGGTRFGRQELEGELIDEAEGALWKRALIEACRAEAPAETARVVIGVDPPASAAGTCGIVVCGVDGHGTAFVLADHSVGGVSPEGWARKVAGAAEAWRAHRVVAEKNNGGAMVESVLRGAAVNLPVKLVHAAEGKAARAAPVATMFEAGRAFLAGRFPALEDELAGLGLAGGYEGPGTSPDRADAMVWAMTELMLGPAAAVPRVRRL